MRHAHKAMPAVCGPKLAVCVRLHVCVSVFVQAELEEIFMGIVAAGKPQPFTLQDTKYARILTQRLARGAGTTGFGNARAVRNTYEQCVQRQSARVIQERKQASGHTMTCTLAGMVVCGVRAVVGRL